MQPFGKVSGLDLGAALAGRWRAQGSVAQEGTKISKLNYRGGKEKGDYIVVFLMPLEMPKSDTYKLYVKYP